MNELVQLLVKHAEENNMLELISDVDDYGQTALHFAASDGNKIACDYLCIAMKAEDINIKTKNSNQTALHFAVQHGHFEISLLLIEKKADKSIVDVNGWTALDWAQKHLKTASKEAIIKLFEEQT